MALDLGKYDAVLLDLDGTIYHEEHALPGARELVGRLRAAGMTHACLSNSTSSPARIHTRLAKMGIEIQRAHVYTAAAATADYVIERFGAGGRRPKVFNLATRGMQELLDGRVEWIGELDDLRTPVSCDAVVVGAPANVYATPQRQRIALHLLRYGAALVGICADRTFPNTSCLEFGCAALGAMLAYATQVEPVYCGKPQPIFFHELCRRLSVDPRRCILIGDNLESDIKGAKGVGMATALVLSGVTRRAQLATIPPKNQPDFVFDGVGDV